MKERHPLRNIIHERNVYNGAIIDVRVDEVKFPSGQVKNREVVLHKAAVAIIAVDDAGAVYLISQYRHAVDEDLVEIPAGIIEAGETPRETAIRELQEEIGLKPGSIEELFTLYSSPGFSNEEVVFFYATDLIEAKLPQDDDECIAVKKYTLAEAEQMIQEGKIKDGKTVIALYWFRRRSLEEKCH